MKNLLNNLSNEEKNRIRAQHKGGVQINLPRFNTLLESTMGNVKPLISENTPTSGTPVTATTINLPDGNYLGSGSGNVYDILDLNGNATGYSVRANKSIRGMKDDDPVTLTGGIPTSETWGQGGTYSFKNVGYDSTKGNTQVQTLTCNMATDGITNVTPEMISSPPFKGNYSGYVISGTFKGINYRWDGMGVTTMNGIRGSVDGEILTENNSYLSQQGITDADPTGTWVGFNGGGFNFACYKSTAGGVKCSKF
jgi:hypothetical protein